MKASPPNESRRRFTIRAMFVVLTLLAIAFAGYRWYDQRYFEPRRRYQAIRVKLETLVTRRPPELSPRQWESAVAWTINLHGNSLLLFQADAATIAAFQKRLDQKLAGPVNLATIHWIWDEYAQLCPGGANYQRFRELMTEEIEAGGGSWGLNVQ